MEDVAEPSACRSAIDKPPWVGLYLVVLPSVVLRGRRLTKG